MKSFIKLMVLISVLSLGLFALAGCDMHYTAKEGEYTCVQCHTDEELLKADLELDPPPVAAESESEGEG